MCMLRGQKLRLATVKCFMPVVLDHVTARWLDESGSMIHYLKKISRCTHDHVRTETTILGVAKEPV